MTKYTGIVNADTSLIYKTYLYHFTRTYIFEEVAHSPPLDLRVDLLMLLQHGPEIFSILLRQLPLLLL